WLLNFGLVVSQNCSHVATRKDASKMRPDEWKQYYSAFRTLANGGQKSVLHRLTSSHVQLASQIHGDLSFLPWHRHFLYEFQRELLKVNNSLILPYWNWTNDATEPHQSIVFNYLGKNGVGSDNCVNFGIGNGVLNVTATSQGTSQRCLQRNFDSEEKISPFIALVGVQELFEQSDFWEFSRRLEFTHAYPHNNLGGDMATMSAPNDPIFWLHHAMVDRIYASWQKKGNNLRKYPKENVNDLLLEYNVNVSSTFDTAAYPYCYRYDSYIDYPLPGRQTSQPTNSGPDGRPNSDSNISNSEPVSGGESKSDGSGNITLFRRHFKQNEFTPTVSLQIQPGITLTIDLTKLTNQTSTWALLQRICPAAICPTNPHIANKQFTPLPRPIHQDWITSNRYPILNFRYLEVKYAILLYNRNLRIANKLSSKAKRCKPKRSVLGKY
ncbi:hypothetical protein L0F63_003112, partial [Massospora cicadina]